MMSVEEGGAYLGLLSFLSFAFSVIAAVTAIDTYRLLRSGEAGKPWRVLIISSVVFALVQVLFIVELFSPRMRIFGLSQIGQLMFALSLAYAFYLQRRLFSEAASLRRHDEARDEDRSHRARHQHLKLLEENNDAPTVEQSGTPAANTVETEDRLVGDGQLVRTVSPYETEDDIEWSQPKVVSR
jgi:hypothetical protein